MLLRRCFIWHLLSYSDGKTNKNEKKESKPASEVKGWLCVDLAMWSGVTEVLDEENVKQQSCSPTDSVYAEEGEREAEADEEKITRSRSSLHRRTQYLEVCKDRVLHH